MSEYSLQVPQAMPASRLPVRNHDMLSRFFIYRPVLATVIAFLTILTGLVCLPRMELARFPDIAPPAVRVDLRYPGASAVTIENTVAQVVEQQMTGLDNLLYFSSRASSEGSQSLSFNFEQSVDPDVAQMQIQNRLQNILTRLPDQVQKNGVTVRKVSDDTLESVTFYCTDGSLSQIDISDFVGSVVQDPLSRVNGVGSVSLLGSPYAIRIWLDEDKLHHYKLNPQDIVSAIEAQNAQISAGQIGGMPSPDSTELNVTIQSRTMLESVPDFENILLSVSDSGAAVYLKDVARVELGRENYTFTGTYNSFPSCSVMINLTEGANAVSTADAVAAFLRDMEPLFPDGLKYTIAYDTVPFVKASLFEVCKTLTEALLLVALVILAFLGDLRSTLIVCATIPVVLAATVTVLYLCGYSINTLTLFAMVLSIGLLVDDAIVVVENVHRLMAEQGLTPQQAAVQSMHEISGALFGVGLVIAAVFLPMSFFGGATGSIYRQFSLTIVSSMLCSIAVALVITPSLCAQYLRPHKRSRQGERRQSWFASGFNALRSVYLVCAGHLMRKSSLCIGVSVFTALVCWPLFKAIPTSFLPDEDQGMVIARVVMPPGYTISQTREVAERVTQYFAEEEGENIEGLMLTLGTSGGIQRGQSTALLWIKLKHWDERPGAARSAQAIKARANRCWRNATEASINVTTPAAVRGMGQSGFNIVVQNIMGYERDVFMQDLSEMVEEAKSSPLLANVRLDNLADSPQLKVVLNDYLASAYHLSPTVINSNLSIAWAGRYVNDFIDRGRIKKVYVQADMPFRSTVSDLGKLYLRNSTGDMVPFSAFGTAEFTFGPVQTQRFNGLSAIPILGEAAEGLSSGQAMEEIARIVSSHRHRYAYAWQGMSYQERLAGSQGYLLFALSALIVFFCLAALYESWIIPFAVMFIVPFGVIGALLMIWGRGLGNDIYLQVGLVTSGGLAAKNAILLIEYAHSFRRRGMRLAEAAAQAARIRFRPIVMTSVAFLLGVMPLMFADGAGASSQISIGSAIVGGTFAATCIGMLFVPAFYIWMAGFGRQTYNDTGADDGTASQQRLPG